MLGQLQLKFGAYLEATKDYILTISIDRRMRLPTQLRLLLLFHLSTLFGSQEIFLIGWIIL